MELNTRSNEIEELVSRRSYNISDEDYSKWLLSVKIRLGLAEDGGWRPVIYKVPRRQTNLYKDPYSPHIVSIGPLHHRKHEFIISETHKWTYMLNLLSNRTRDPRQALEGCAKVVRNLEMEGRRSYAENIELKKHEMMEILLVDGCFMLEIFIRYTERFSGGYNDSIVGKEWLVEELQQDFAVLENQIPYVVLQSLFNMVREFSNENLVDNLEKCVLFFFGSDAIEEKSQLLKGKSIMHILDMLYHVYLATTMPEKPLLEMESVLMINQMTMRGSRRSSGKVYSARDLHLGGIQLVKGEGNQFLDITFEKGILTIPCLSIDRTTTRIFRNLVTFEQLNSIGTYPMSSYAILMSSLIKSSEDVKLLEQKGIIEQTSGKARDVVGLFQDLFQEATLLGNFGYVTLLGRIDEYMADRPRYRRVVAWFTDFWCGSIEILKIDYFKNVWTTLSVAAAVILLALTALQTVYSVISYYK